MMLLQESSDRDSLLRHHKGVLGAPMFPTVTAVALQREFATGTTKPCLMLCETGDGTQEYVTKFRSEVRNGAGGLCFECFAALLGLHFGIPMPSPALVQLSSNLADAVLPHAPGAGARIRSSAGLNFGTLYLAGYTTWPIDQPIPVGLRQTAAEILAFDALIENVDRRRENPNILATSDDIRAFDHEVAFSFLFDFNPARSWQEKFSFLSQHVFYNDLRGRALDLSRFSAALSNLSDSALDSMSQSIPSSFGPEYSARICDHLRRARGEATAFMDALRGTLQ